MNAFRMVVCSLVVGAGVLGGASKASASGLIGFYVYGDAYGRGLVISNFIPGSSADVLRMQGELYPGDIITRYAGRRVYSAAQVRWISSQVAPGSWLKMEFLTPDGQYFWHWVQPGGGVAAACVEGIGVRSSGPVYHKFKRGTRRPGSSAVRRDGPGRPGMVVTAPNRRGNVIIAPTGPVRSGVITIQRGRPGRPGRGSGPVRNSRDYRSIRR